MYQNNEANLSEKVYEPFEIFNTAYQLIIAKIKGLFILY